MQNAINSNSTFSVIVPVIGRVLLAAIFLISGIGKLAAPGMTVGYIGAMGLPFPTMGYLVALGIEISGGLLLVLGYKTRITALLLAAFSIFTGIVFHHALGDQNQMFHLLKNLAMAGGLLQLVAYGAGAFSLDNRTGTAAVAHAR